MQKQCEVCEDLVAKYKCPQCSTKYCSVKCYKQHKEAQCVLKNIHHNHPKTDGVPQSSVSESEREEGELSDDDDGTITEDHVDRQKLEMLEESEQLCMLLGNPHLRVMMTALADTEDPTKLMEAAMKEPIFTEFADECLKIVEPEETGHPSS